MRKTPLDFPHNHTLRDGCVKSYHSRTIVHAKLEMTEPGDHDEREADAIANAVVSGGKISRKISGGGGGSSGIAVSQQMESQLSQLQGGGRQMPEGLRNMMESGFGQDFSQVRLHTDNEAASMSSSIHAKAFTLGNDIYFNRGQFAPETTEGQRLVAHELTHVVQGVGKVGRDTIDDYVSDGWWLQECVLNDEVYTELKNNYLTPKDKRPVSIVVLTTMIGACQGETGVCPFEEGQGKGPITSLIQHSKSKFFQLNDEDIRVLMIQGALSMDDLCLKIQKITDKYGRLKDVIIRGHGNSNVIDLGNFEINNNNIGKIIDVFGNNLSPESHTLILGGCLTDTLDTGLSASARKHIEKNGFDIMVQGNEASVETSVQQLKYDVFGKELRLYNTDDTEKKSPKSDGESHNYDGCNPKGIIKALIRIIDSNNPSVIPEFCDYGIINKSTINPSTYSHSNINNCSVMYSESSFGGQFSDGTNYQTISVRELIELYKREVNNNREKLKRFLIALDNATIPLECQSAININDVFSSFQ